MIMTRIWNALREVAHIAILFGFVVLINVKAVAAPANVTLAWDPSDDPTVSGYNLYYGSASGTYTNVVVAGTAITATVSNLMRGATYYFAATTFTEAGLESDYSIEISYAVPGDPAGSLQVALSPAAAVAAGAQWQLDGGPWQTSGTTINGLAVGNHTVGFNSVSGWASPASQTVSVVASQTNSAAGVYVALAQTGSLQISLSPADAVRAGAQWRVYGGAWQNSGATVTGLSVSNHTVTFSSISGWTTPGSQTVAISANQVTSSSAAYIAAPQSGSLQVMLSPAAATSAGAQWQVDGGTWQNSGVTVTGLSVGDHTVAFKSVSSWTTPASQVTTVTANQTAAFTATYTSVSVPQTPTNTWTLCFQNTSSTLAAWSMVGTNMVSATLLEPSSPGAEWRVAGVGSFSGNGGADLLMQSQDGQIATWFMDGTNRVGGGCLNPSSADPNWKVVGTGDFTGDGKTTILWEHTSGALAYWFMNSTNRVGSGYLNPSIVDPNWKIVGTGDFNGDGKTDILWQNQCGVLACWFMDGTNLTAACLLNPSTVDPSWKVVGTIDINQDGNTDILWEHTSGYLAVWYMNGTNLVNVSLLNPGRVDPSWKVVGGR
jgi:hypothetical protein